MSDEKNNNELNNIEVGNDAMNTMTGDSKQESSDSGQGMESGTYEVIKKRLHSQGQDLKGRLEKLNIQRKAVFGSIETGLKTSERIITENNCVPRDMAPVDNRFVFGYNVHIGLKSKVEISDVFAVYLYDGSTFTRENLSLIDDEQFKKDFDDLYRYYKNTFFAKFTIMGPYFYMVFQTGTSPRDIKVFKWAIEGEKLVYVDNRSDHEITLDDGNQLSFKRATRDDHRAGLHPHVSILDKVFVETIGGDLTIKVEDNTETGKGIYSEDVEDKDQTLDDAEIAYSDLGQLIILKIRPYKEEKDRYFIYNHKLKSVVRIDSIKDTCQLLPGGHGLIFPKGYYLQNGEYKIFDVPALNCVFDQMNSSINGEDYQFIFYNLDTGIYLIYSYNVIEQTIDTPIVCSGYSHFNNGEMIVFKHEDEPRKNHMIQLWVTPYVGKNFEVEANNESELFNIGNKDIVSCMADCRGVSKLIDKGESYQSVYVDIVKESEQILDSYFWLTKDEAFNLAEILKQVKDTASFAVGEFEKVVRLKKSTKKQIDKVAGDTKEFLTQLQYESFDQVSTYVEALASLRNLRGRIVSLRDLRYTDLDLVDKLEKEVKDKNEVLSAGCVDFLIKPEGLEPYEDRVEALKNEIPSVKKSKEGKELDEKMDKTSEELELLMDIVGNFKIDDPTLTSAIIDKISGLFSLINNAKAKIKSKVETFVKSEMTVQFNAQMKLLSQSVVNYLDLIDTEEKCDQYLNKVMVQMQELEGKFSEFDEYIVALDEKSQEIYTAFETKKQAILEKLNKRIISLFDSANRVIQGISNRLKSFDDVEAINGYLATDLMAEKVRDIIDELRILGDNVKADEISSKLKALKENTLRQLKDRQELFVDGQQVIKFGKHRFSVNTKAIDLTVVKREEDLYYHITGTDFWDPIDDEKIYKYRHVFDQSILSENKDVYRGEFLAYQFFIEGIVEGNEAYSDLKDKTEAGLIESIRSFMEPRYQEGYTKGVHDQDGGKILKALIELHDNIDLLIFDYKVRAMARLFWQRMVAPDIKERLNMRLKHLAKISGVFRSPVSLKNYVPFLEEKMTQALSQANIFDGISEEDVYNSANYLCQEVMRGDDFVVSRAANNIYESFLAYLRNQDALEAYENSVKGSRDDLEGQYYLIKEWVSAFWQEVMVNDQEVLDDNYKSPETLKGVMDEVIILLMDEGNHYGQVVQVGTRLEVSDLVGSHPRIDGGVYVLTYTEFMSRLKHFSDVIIKDFESYQEIKQELVADFKKNLRLENFKPQVLTSFVRNKLIDDVYLPLIGDNLAKQIGVVGNDKRTDLMGLLLLVSPPGYGKTTLMEYIASRLGIILVKVNGPSLGHEVTSLDPEKASHSSAREELRKLNLALKMGNNVMIYVDDIQHCNPEFLQKFISLCDGQRKIEGVYKGRGQTYDLRGKKVAVVMAGNPYTESGEKFKIPDMLANRADVYNLGDMLNANEEAFKLSYLENSLTSNPILSPLASGNKEDLYGLIKLAQGADRETVDLSRDYSVDELHDYTEVIQKLFKVRDVVLKVNMEYIYSAAQADEYRKEPPFKLQGSYRNMNKIAEKVVAVMNEEELESTILANYENDCQTLTSGAEANMLKWKELNGVITEEEAMRLAEIRTLFVKNKLVKGDDQMGKAVLALSELSEQLGRIREILSSDQL